MGFKCSLIGIFFLLGLVACQPAEEGGKPPEEMVGAWSEISPSSKASTMNSGAKVSSKACEEFDVNDQGVSYGLLKIQKNGLVVSHQNIHNPAQLYREEGFVNEKGQFFPNESAKRTYLAEAYQLADQYNYNVTHEIMLKYSKHAVKGVQLEMVINVKLSTGPMTMDMPTQTRTYLQTSQAGENYLTSKLTECLHNIP